MTEQSEKSKGKQKQLYIPDTACSNANNNSAKLPRLCDKDAPHGPKYICQFPSGFLIKARTIIQAIQFYLVQKHHNLHYYS